MSIDYISIYAILASGGQTHRHRVRPPRGDLRRRRRQMKHPAARSRACLTAMAMWVTLVPQAANAHTSEQYSGRRVAYMSSSYCIQGAGWQGHTYSQFATYA